MITTELRNGTIVVFGCPDSEAHNCDEMWCGSVGPHVLEYIGTELAAQELYRLRARVNDEHNALALIDKLHEDIRQLTVERDQLKARIAELELHELEVSRLTGIVYEADYHCHAGPRDQVLAEIERLKGEARDACELRQRIAELEAPPVVPDGWEVTPVIRAQRDGWALSYVASVVGVWYPDTGQVRITTLAPGEAIRAFVWAIENDQRPPHEGDEPRQRGSSA